MNGLQNQSAWRSPFPNPKLNETRTIIKSLNSKAISEVKSGFLNYRRVEFDAGHSVGYPSSWSLFLISCGSSKSNNKGFKKNRVDPYYCGLFLDHIYQISETDMLYNVELMNSVEFLVRYKIEILEQNGNVLITRDLETFPRNNFSKGYWGWRQISPIPFEHFNVRSTGTDAMSSDSEDLDFRITFSIIGRKKDNLLKIPSSCVNLLTHEQNTEREIAMNFYDLVAQGTTEPNVVIESGFGQQFLVHKDVLAARSPVFRAMFKTSMTEGISKKATIDDISPKAMDCILRHVYTGQVETDWLSSPRLASELVYVAGQYWLNTLMNFCDKNLIRAATTKNYLHLLELASLHDLDCALDDLALFKQKMTPDAEEKDLNQGLEIGDKE